MRSWPGGPPNGKTVGTVLKIVARAGRQGIADRDSLRQTGVERALLGCGGRSKHGDFAGECDYDSVLVAEKGAVKLRRPYK